MHPKPQWQTQFLTAHQLPLAYLHGAAAWFEPLANSMAITQKDKGRTIIVGVNGCQGSGKTTLCDYLCQSLNHHHGLSAVALSLDDFYLTQQERRTLAANIHPLLRTRGVPGTHDHKLLRETLAALTKDRQLHRGNTSVSIPRFDKASDERRAPEAWDTIRAPCDIVLLEGWCMGATAEPAAALQNPINALERDEDAQSIWRQYSNRVLAKEFQPLYEQVDIWVMLAAPSFKTVLGWRIEQEQKLLQPTHSMDDVAIAAFVNHFERITQHCLLELPPKVNHLHNLDAQRNIVSYRYSPTASILPTSGP